MTNPEQENKTDLAVEIQGLWCHRGDMQVVKGLDLSIHKGETVAIIGPSGGGKSTLLRCLNGLTSFEKGKVTLGGETLLAGGQTPLKKLRTIRQNYGMIFQDYRLFPHKSVLANVMEGPLAVLGATLEQARQLAENLLKRVGLGQFGNRFPDSLSGGQQQRVAIARTLAMRPCGLLCDEITAALDPELKGEVLNLLAELKADGLTILMVTHEMGFARQSADRIVLLDGGTIIENGPPDQVLDRPRSERSHAFLKRVLA